jgi:hypothetical protein
MYEVGVGELGLVGGLVCRWLRGGCVGVLFGVPWHLRVLARQLELTPPQSPIFPPSLSHLTMRLLARSIARPRTFTSRCGIATASGRRHLTNNGFFRVSEEVREALHSKKPIVALETTIYTHGGNTSIHKHSLF